MPRKTAEPPAGAHDFPTYEVPSWEITKGTDDDDDVAEAAAVMGEERAIANAAWFFADRRDKYTIDEAAELLQVAPAEVDATIRATVLVPYREDGYFGRVDILAVATERQAWTPEDLDRAMRRVLTPERSAVPSERLAAIRAFFTSPKESYSVDELRTIFADDLDIDATLHDLFAPEPVEEFVDRQTIADFLLGRVPPVVVGRALEGLPAGPLTNESRTIELPRWLWAALDEVAQHEARSVSDVLSTELTETLRGSGLSAAFDDVADIPKYDSIVADGVALRPERGFFIENPATGRLDLQINPETGEPI